jgi:ubiquinone/menaquinone biosynthesis C-methylase UbiE
VSFDRVARHYYWLETFAFSNALQHARIFWLDKIPAPQRVLIIGEGNGRFLCELVNAHDRIDVDCVDASAQMLLLARRRLLQNHTETSEHVRFIREDINSWQPAVESYDLIVTHFFLDCFPRDEADYIVTKLSHAAARSAVWLLADFAIPETRYARWRARTWLYAMYLFFRSVAGIRAKCLVDPTPLLEANGFVCVGRELSSNGMVKSEYWRRS